MSVIEKLRKEWAQNIYDWIQKNDLVFTKENAVEYFSLSFMSPREEVVSEVWAMVMEIMIDEITYPRVDIHQLQGSDMFSKEDQKLGFTIMWNDMSFDLKLTIKQINKFVDNIQEQVKTIIEDDARLKKNLGVE